MFLLLSPHRSRDKNGKECSRRIECRFPQLDPPVEVMVTIIKRNFIPRSLPLFLCMIPTEAWFDIKLHIVLWSKIVFPDVTSPIQVTGACIALLGE
jgi:hypothetical protein